MAVRIKTISNEVPGGKRPEHRGAHKPGKDESRQSSKILELEWEALGRKLNKHPGSELEKLRRQLREKDERLRQADQKIAALRRELMALQNKHRTPQQKQMVHGPKPGSHGGFKAPARMRK